MTDNEFINHAVPSENLLIDLVFKPNTLGKRPAPAEIQVLLAYSQEILAEAAREEQRIIDEPSTMRETSVGQSANIYPIDNEVPPCT